MGVCVLVCSQGVCVCVCVCVLVCSQGVRVCLLSQNWVLSPGAQSPHQHADCCFQTIFVSIGSWGRGCINPPPPTAQMTAGRGAVKQTLKL